MNLSSRTTWFYPFILLLASSFYCIYIILDRSFRDDGPQKYFLIFIISSILTAILFLAFKKLAVLFSTNKFLKYILIIIPSVVYILATKYVEFDFLAIIAGLFLFLSFSAFSNRYIAKLTEKTISYQNLLGQSGEISLTDIVKLEQKRNILAFIREFRLLDLSRKTGITFTDENLDEYEINIFTKVYKENTLFSKIIENANNCGNLKIRQYTV